MLHELCLAAERDEAAERAENEKKMKAQGKKIPQASRAGPTAPSSGVGASSSGVGASSSGVGASSSGDAQVQIPEHEHDFQRVVAETLGNRMAIDGKPKTNRNAWVTRRKIEGLTMLHLAKYLAFYATERNTAITTKIETPDGIIPYYIGRRLLDCYDARTLPDDAMYFMRRSPPWREVIARRKKNLPKKGLKDIDFARWVLTSCHLAPSLPRSLAVSRARSFCRMFHENAIQKKVSVAHKQPTKQGIVPFNLARRLARTYEGGTIDKKSREFMDKSKPWQTFLKGRQERQAKAAKRKENDELRAVRGAKIRAGFAAKKIREAKEKEEKEKEKERQAKEKKVRKKAREPLPE